MTKDSKGKELTDTKITDIKLKDIKLTDIKAKRDAAQKKATKALAKKPVSDAKRAHDNALYSIKETEKAIVIEQLLMLGLQKESSYKGTQLLKLEADLIKAQANLQPLFKTYLDAKEAFRIWLLEQKK
jgi:hypothetical protein